MRNSNEIRNRKMRIVLISFIGLISFVWNMRLEWSNSFSMIENKLKTSWVGELKRRTHTLYNHHRGEWNIMYIKLKNPHRIQKIQFIFIICRNSYSIFDAVHQFNVARVSFACSCLLVCLLLSELFSTIAHITSYAYV